MFEESRFRTKVKVLFGGNELIGKERIWESNNWKELEGMKFNSQFYQSISEGYIMSLIPL